LRWSINNQSNKNTKKIEVFSKNASQSFLKNQRIEMKQINDIEYLLKYLKEDEIPLQPAIDVVLTTQVEAHHEAKVAATPTAWPGNDEAHQRTPDDALRVSQFEAGVSANEVVVSRTDSDWVLSIAGTTEKIVVPNFVVDILSSGWLELA
jgi:hypothetical protein